MSNGILYRARRFLESRNMSLIDVPIWAVGMFIAFLWALPFLWMVSTSFKLPSHVMTKDIEWLPREVTFDNYIKIFEYPVIRWGLNSIIQAVGSTTLCVLFGAMAGYALARMRFPGNNLIFVIFLATVAIGIIKGLSKLKRKQVESSRTVLGRGV